jgi:hypothetical protein
MQASAPRWNWRATASAAIVLDAAEPGFGGSTRSGGLVSAGVNVGKRMINKALTPEEARPFLNDAVDAFSNIESVISENKIDCGWTKTGYFLGAWCIRISRR